MKKTNLLIVISKPTDMGAIDPNNEERIAIEESLKKYEPLPIRYDFLVNPTPEQLWVKLQEYRPEILHFISHGDENKEIVLVDANGTSKPISHVSLKKFLSQTPSVKMVLMNACYSVDQAQVIREVVDCVIGMKAMINNEPAKLFAAEFYRNIGMGNSALAAFNAAKDILGVGDNPAELVPEILFRDTVTGDKLRLISWSKICLEFLQSVSINQTKQEEYTFGNGIASLSLRVEIACQGEIKALKASEPLISQQANQLVHQFTISGEWECTLGYFVSTNFNTSVIKSLPHFPDGINSAPQKVKGTFAAEIRVAGGNITVLSTNYSTNSLNKNDKRVKDATNPIDEVIKEKITQISQQIA